MSQSELAKLVGYEGEDPIYQHERAITIPPLLVAFAYEAVFGIPAADLFPGIYETVAQQVEARIDVLEKTLQAKSRDDRDSNATARKLGVDTNAPHGYRNLSITTTTCNPLQTVPESWQLISARNDLALRCSKGPTIWWNVAPGAGIPCVLQAPPFLSEREYFRS